MVNKKSLVSVALTLSALTLTAQASEWGCKCLLCLADPRGPTTESECQPPIHKLWRHLAKGKPFPTCEMSGDSQARMGNSHYETCPENYSALGNGQLAIKQSEIKKSGVGIPFHVGSGDNSTDRARPTVCVSGLVGSKKINIPTNTNPQNSIIAASLQDSGPGLTVSRYAGSQGWGTITYKTVTAGVYTDIKRMRYHGRMIDVFIDGKLHQRVPVGVR